MPFFRQIGPSQKAQNESESIEFIRLETVPLKIGSLGSLQTCDSF